MAIASPGVANAGVAKADQVQAVKAARSVFAQCCNGTRHLAEKLG